MWKVSSSSSSQQNFRNFKHFADKLLCLAIAFTASASADSETGHRNHLLLSEVSLV